MDSDQRLKKNQPVFFVNQSSRKIILLFTLLTAIACQNTGKKTGSSSAKKDSEAEQSLEQQIKTANATEFGVQLTQVGNSSDPFLSSDGKKLLYVSANRKSHQQKQVYMLDFDSMKERRLTFNDGDNNSPVLVEGYNLFAYASNTDFLKEHPNIFYPKLNQSERDIYLSEISGSAIERIPAREGFDGELQAVPGKKGMIVFQGISQTRRTVTQLNVNNKNLKALFSLPTGAKLIRQSPDQKNWLWLLSESDGKQILELSSNTNQAQAVKSLPLPFESVAGLNWITPKSIILSGQPSASLFTKDEKIEKNLIAVLDLEKNCLQKIIKGDAFITYPLFDLPKQAAIFVVESAGNLQIYLKQINLSEIPCLTF